MAATTMYRMKPFYGDSDVVEAYPTCMYKMKNIHAESGDDVDMSVYPELLGLKNRQETLLRELEKLKLEVGQIGVDIGINSQSTATKAKVPSEKQPPINTASPCDMDIVIKACPDDPPLSVYLLYKLARQHGHDCSTKSHFHSSCSGQVPAGLYELFHTSSTKDSNNCLRFIWKSDILAPSLMVSVVNQSPILAETNILRYLTRLFLPHLYSGNDQPLHTTIIDDWLNTALKLTLSKEAKDEKTFIQTLNSHLGKHNWLAGNAPSIADIYCCVTLLRNNHGGQLSKNVGKWMTECRKVFPGLDNVERFCK